MVELLSPVGDFECLKSAVQNGADSVYFGGNLFNARASATNFDRENLKKAIMYAKLRNVKINFTLNTLLKDSELQDAIDLASYVYSLGCDAIIVQDLGLAKFLINNFPNMDVHASTQITAHNLEGVIALQKIGFKRVVLSRELSIGEIEYISNHSDVEIETFVHGALCISYSGQCLFSSLVGGRSGNRGRCAQACRLPYELIKKDSSSNSYTLDKGYLLSPRDLCGLKYIPDLIKSGVKCFKIEGRMKPPSYVGTVTRIYRKYIDLALSSNPYVIDDNDVKDLLQVFNRGGFSTGNLDNEPNTSYVYKEKPNNMGLYCGNISNYNSSKGLITFKTQEPLAVGDNVSTQNESYKYTISELMINENNVKNVTASSTVTIGRLKGNIHIGDKIYKLSSYSKNVQSSEYSNKENIKIPLSAVMNVIKGKKLSLEVTSLDSEHGNYFSMSSYKEFDLIPIDAISNPITDLRIKEQLNKTTDTQFEFKYIKVNIEDNTYIPKISSINQLRRDCLSDLENQAISRFERKFNDLKTVQYSDKVVSKNDTRKYVLLLNELNLDYDYSKLSYVDKLYIPIKYFLDKKYISVLKSLAMKFNVYIYLPTIIKDNYRNIIFNNLDNFINDYNIKGVIVSNISGTEFLDKYYDSLEICANYTFNVFNLHTIKELSDLGIKEITLSPELDKTTLQNLSTSSCIPTELMVYGRVPLMNAGYCLIGCSNRCYPTCNMECNSSSNSKFYLRDRLGLDFRIIPDKMQTVTTIFNSKITSIGYSDIPASNLRISILDEDIDTINDIIDHVKSDIPFSGENFTNGNLNRFV